MEAEGNSEIQHVQTPEREVVYGIDVPFSEGAIFLRRPDAETLVDINDALTSETWGELRRKMAEIGEDISWWTDEDDPPADDDAFTPDDAPGLADGYYPSTAPEVMLGWLPEELADKYGQVVATPNGYYLQIDADKVDAVVQELRQSGYSVSRDDALIAWTMEGRP